MTTIDHAAEARRVLKNFPHDDLRSNQDALAWAQVHAQLAVAEQLRIANIIALSVPQETFNGGQACIPSYDEDGKLIGPIAEGLGLS